MEVQFDPRYWDMGYLTVEEESHWVAPTNAAAAAGESHRCGSIPLRCTVCNTRYVQSMHLVTYKSGAELTSWELF